MDPKTVILSEVSQTEKDKYHMISLVSGTLKIYKWTYLQNRNRPTDIENKHDYESRGGIHEKLGINRYKLWYIK